MPVTQTRIISIINAALDFAQGFKDAKAMVAREARSVQQGKQTPMQAIEAILILMDRADTFLEDPVGTLTTIETERRHFESRAKSNAKAAARMQAWRDRQRGIERPRVAARGRFIKLPEPAPAGVPAAAPADAPAAGVNLAWDETDPENAFADGADLTSLLDDQIAVGEANEAAAPPPVPLLKSTLSPEQRALIDLENEIYSAPAAHLTEIGADGSLWCKCSPGKGMSLAAWREHLGGAGGASGDTAK